MLLLLSAPVTAPVLLLANRCADSVRPSFPVRSRLPWCSRLRGALRRRFAASQLGRQEWKGAARASVWSSKLGCHETHSTGGTSSGPVRVPAIRFVEQAELLQNSLNHPDDWGSFSKPCRPTGWASLAAAKFGQPDQRQGAVFGGLPSVQSSGLDHGRTYSASRMPRGPFRTVGVHVVERI